MAIVHTDRVREREMEASPWCITVKERFLDFMLSQIEHCRVINYHIAEKSGGRIFSAFAQKKHIFHTLYIDNSKLCALLKGMMLSTHRPSLVLYLDPTTPSSHSIIGEEGQKGSAKWVRV